MALMAAQITAKMTKASLIAHLLPPSTTYSWRQSLQWTGYQSVIAKNMSGCEALMPAGIYKVKPFNGIIVHLYCNMANIPSCHAIETMQHNIDPSLLIYRSRQIMQTS